MSRSVPRPGVSSTGRASRPLARRDTPSRGLLPLGVTPAESTHRYRSGSRRGFILLPCGLSLFKRGCRFDLRACDSNENHGCVISIWPVKPFETSLVIARPSSIVDCTSVRGVCCNLFRTRGVINGTSSPDAVRDWLLAVASLPSLC